MSLAKQTLEHIRKIIGPAEISHENDLKKRLEYYDYATSIPCGFPILEIKNSFRKKTGISLDNFKIIQIFYIKSSTGRDIILREKGIIEDIRYGSGRPVVNYVIHFPKKLIVNR